MSLKSDQNRVEIEVPLLKRGTKWGGILSICVYLAFYLMEERNIQRNFNNNICNVLSF